MFEPWQVFVYATVCGIVGGLVGAMIYLWFEGRLYRKDRS